MTLLILVRHGTTEALGKVLSGRAPGYSLNAEGWAQIRALKTGLATLHLDAVYTSPLERAMTTAAALASPRELPVRIDERLSDIHFGTWTGRAISELSHDPGFIHFNAQRSMGHPPGGERTSEVQARMVSALQEWVEQFPRGTLAVVGHADPLKLAIAFFIGLSADHARRLEIDPASTTALELVGHGARLLHLNQKYTWPAERRGV